MAELPLKRVLRMGAHGSDVAAVHIGLRRAGCRVKLGRHYTRNVRDQMKHFQHHVNEKHPDANLVVDGVYGAKTHKYLQKHFNKFARRLYKQSLASTDVRNLSAVQAALRLEHYYHEHRYTPDRIEDYQDIVATANGRKVRNALGYYVAIDKRVLQALCFLIEKHKRIGTFAICSDHHYDGMHGHAGGHAFDVSQIRGVEVSSFAARPLVLEVSRTLHSGMPKGLGPWQLICGGYGNRYDPEISALTVPGAWFYGPTTMSQHRNHIHAGWY